MSDVWQFWIEDSDVPKVGMRPSAFYAASDGERRGLCWCDTVQEAKEIGLRLARRHIAWVHHRQNENYVDVEWTTDTRATLTFRP